MTLVAGADGYKNGWVVVECRLPAKHFDWRLLHTFDKLADLATRYPVIAVDIPIGLLDSAEPGGRQCDRDARCLLGSPRKSSVFSPPVRSTLRLEDFKAACTANRKSSPHGIGISKQSHGLRKKLLEADDQMSAAPDLQGQGVDMKNRKIAGNIFEVHPELCFMQLAGQPMKYSKKKMNGRSERIAHLLKELPALASVIENFRRQPHNGAAEDDLFDACVACWTALRIYRREALAVPEIAARDDQGLLMQIWR